MRLSAATACHGAEHLGDVRVELAVVAVEGVDLGGDLSVADVLVVRLVDDVDDDGDAGHARSRGPLVPFFS
ncbi:hypothetical protein GCM10020000_17620 [Streptomyces olivoverticillatus]